MPKADKPKKSSSRHDPLEKSILEAEGKTAPKIKSRQKQRNRLDDEKEQDEYVPHRVSKKILQQARTQQIEEDSDADDDNAPSADYIKKNQIVFTEESGGAEAWDESDAVDAEGFVAPDVDISEEDERALAAFMTPGPLPQMTLSEMIMSKIQEKEAMGGMAPAAEGPLRDPKVVQVFTGIGRFLSQYSSGKLPKAFKLVPSLTNWEEVLYYTKPESWTPNAMHAATKLFASNLNESMAQRFFNLVLLPAVRDNILEYKKLNWHLYMALKKALYKPGAWFKGILLPLCESGDCTLREAVIVSSVLSKVSVPVIHSAAALMKLAEMEYSGANSYFIKTILQKKYALPYKVLNAVVEHFVRFTEDSRQLPVLWHQALLVMAQRYKDDLTPLQKEGVKNLVRVHNHHLITAEVRRELFSVPVVAPSMATLLAQQRSAAIAAAQDMICDL